MGLYSQTGSRSFISVSAYIMWGEAVQARRRGSGRASVRPRLHHRIVSSRRRVARDACPRARSLRYAAGLRRAVTRHVWRDRCCYACDWCSVNTGYCASSAVTMRMCWFYKILFCLKGFLTTQPVPEQLSRWVAVLIASGKPCYLELTHFRPRPIRPNMTVTATESGFVHFSKTLQKWVMINFGGTMTST